MAVVSLLCSGLGIATGCGGGEPLGDTPGDQVPGEQPGEPAPESPDAPAVAGCEGEAGFATDAVWTIVSGGREREFAVHVPAGYDPAVPTPVVLNFHGYTSNASQQQTLSGMNELADAEGFIAVHPEGIGLAQSWNAGVCCGDAAAEQVDDVLFVKDMLDELESRLCIDTRRVYSTGFSNGGFLSHRLACELSDRIAAVATVAGVLGVAPSSCAPPRPVPVFHFHGTWDTLVPIAGNPATRIPPMAQTLEHWSSHNGCDTATTVTWSSGDTTCQSFDGCPDAAPVTYCIVAAGGHTWPGGFPIPAMGKTTYALSASERMWDFFTGFQLPE